MRLIDADKLKVHLEKSEFTTKNKMVERGGNEMLHYFMPKIIDDEPTFNREGCCICGAGKKMFELKCSNTKQTVYICGSCAKDIAEQHFSEKNIKLGRWEWDGCIIRCSVCNERPPDDWQTDFCPNCGARMED